MTRLLPFNISKKTQLIKKRLKYQRLNETADEPGNSTDSAVREKSDNKLHLANPIRPCKIHPITEEKEFDNTVNDNGLTGAKKSTIPEEFIPTELKETNLGGSLETDSQLQDSVRLRHRRRALIEQEVKTDLKKLYYIIVERNMRECNM